MPIDGDALAQLPRGSLTANSSAILPEMADRSFTDSLAVTNGRGTPQPCERQLEYARGHLESVKLVQGIAALLSAKHLPPRRELSIHPPFTSL